MSRCNYQYYEFTDKYTYRGYGTDQCWVEEVGNFGSIEAPEYFCIFHAPVDREPIDRDTWPLKERDANQARYLRALLFAWNAENEQRKADGQVPLAFVLPHLRCKRFDFDSHVFSAPFSCPGATFDCNSKFKEATFRGYANFGGATFKSSAFFDGATFVDGATFRGATFNGAVVFDTATFRGYANFGGATFVGGAVFDGATFGNDANFDGATFRDGAGNFGGATFEGDASFKGATFEGGARFKGATFQSDAGFDEATFKGNVLLVEATFEGEAGFEGATFVGGAGFGGATFGKRLDVFGCHFPHPTSITNCTINELRYGAHTGERLSFHQCTPVQKEGLGTGLWNFAGNDCSRLSFLITDLTRANFLGADVRTTRFDCCTWLRGSRYVDVYVPEGADAKLQRSLYQQLQRNLEDSRDYALAGDFHYQEMKVRQKLFKGCGPSLERAVLWLYGAVSDFGENWQKLLRVVMGFLVSLALLVSFMEAQNGAERPIIKAILEWPHYLRIVMLGLVPSGLQRQVLEEARLHLASQAAIVAGGLTLAVLAILFVMAIRRRFRR